MKLKNIIIFCFNNTNTIKVLYDINKEKYYDKMYGKKKSKK